MQMYFVVSIYNRLWMAEQNILPPVAQRYLKKYKNP